MLRITGLILFIAIQQVLPAQDLVLPLWPAGKVPNHQKTSETEIRDTARIVKIQLVQTPEIAIYLPTRQTATGRAVVICPGGIKQFLLLRRSSCPPPGYYQEKISMSSFLL